MSACEIAALLLCSGVIADRKFCGAGDAGGRIGNRSKEGG